MKHARAHRTDREKKAMTSEEKFVFHVIVKADALAKEGAEEDGGAMLAAQALTIGQLRT